MGRKAKIKRDKSTQSVEEYMFRYLEKYHGTYRVLSDYDLHTLDWPRDEEGNIDESFDDLYIPCRKGVIKHCYDDYDKLALCFYNKNASVVKNIYSEIKKRGPERDLELEDMGRDHIIYFYAEDMDKIAPVVVPRKSGAKIRWDAKSNKKLFKKKK